MRSGVLAGLVGLSLALAAVSLGQTLPSTTSGSGAAQATTSAAPANGRVIGKLGQAIVDTKIRASRSSSARVFSTAKAFQYLVVNTTDNPQWLSVVLVNGKSGFVLADDVISLPYDVVMPNSGGSVTTASRSSTRTSNPAGGTGTVGATQEVQEMLNFSYRFIGTPYRWGGNSLTGGIDCSAFVQQVFRRRGVNLPRTAAEQARVGTPVARIEDLRPGDRLYFWEYRRRTIGHTGIFMGFFPDGGAYFIHSSSNNRGIATDDLRVKKWRDLLVSARRD